MRPSVRSCFAAVAFGAAASMAQDFCAPVTEYVTVTAVEPIASEVTTMETPSSDLMPATDVFAITTSESFCELSPVTITTTLEPTTITVYTSPTEPSVAETECSLSTVWETEILEPTTVTIYPSSIAMSSMDMHSIVSLQSDAAPEVAPTTKVTQDIPYGPSSPVVPAPTPTPSSVVESPSFVLVSQVEGTKTSSTLPAASQTHEDTTGYASKSGQATFYDGNVDGGMCSFTGYKIPSGIFGTALSDSNWDNAGACGACMEVTGPSGKKITAMVVDQCPGCGTNHLDLFREAFAELAEPSKGVIDVSWSIVPCGITSPITLKNKSGTSKYYFNIQVENSNVQVQKVDVSTDGGKTWKDTTRKDYNYFEIHEGTGTDSVSVKITSVGGKTITVHDVSCADSATMSAGSNF
ncbi:barwin-like endoglucanase [Pseudovirgaria hyperparasitica]|uniref:Barwin-like endoglucanase n=1 Tax=Pseudovirgaria hyperparasitica TaxID=470096 RepID=A0A6A6W1W2_9PEZI|nr:barwin-like endoglucanase [Pseudovirgaria hyperparasitica]KAF2755994.1 barwin-like endoglucanase [Pseudovirgaria hyperparasitica]